MIGWTKIEDGLPAPLEAGSKYGFLSDRFPFRPLLFIGKVMNESSYKKYRSYFGRYDHELKIWRTMDGAKVDGVTHWTEYNEPDNL